MIRVLTQSLKIGAILLLGVTMVAGSAAFFNYWTDHTRSAEIGRPVTIEITQDDDTSSVAAKLTKANLVKYGFYFEAKMRLSGGELRPGTYTILKGESVSDIIKRITVPSNSSGGSANSNQAATAPAAINVTFVEGQRLEQYGAELEKAGFPNGREAFMKAVANPANRQGFDFLSGLPANASLQGFLFPDTYRFGSDATADQIVVQMLTNFDNRFTPEMRAQQKASGLSMLQVVTVASIVEREAVVPEERPVIAKVYLNRVAQGMLLNADPTLQYSIGSEADWWPKVTDAAIALDSPYNTYKYTGLPPGPISNPGLASIQAVLQPADVTYLYFVAKDDGSNSHVFANTNDEQNQNRCTYLKDCGGNSTDTSGGAAPTETPSDQQIVPPGG
ncbi:MAG: endolytic transglycosylase MltG [Thermomicrobiales bacterium]